MKANERLEALLNRAGVTLTDMPPVRSEGFENVRGVIRDEYGEYTEENALRYIINLAEIIDRMESAVENAINGGHHGDLWG